MTVPAIQRYNWRWTAAVDQTAAVRSAGTERPFRPTLSQDTSRFGRRVVGRNRRWLCGTSPAGLESSAANCNLGPRENSVACPFAKNDRVAVRWAAPWPARARSLTTDRPCSSANIKRQLSQTHAAVSLGSPRARWLKPARPHPLPWQWRYNQPTESSGHERLTKPQLQVGHAAQLALLGRFSCGRT